MKTIYLIPLVLISLSCQKEIDISTSGSFNGGVYIEGLLYAEEEPKIYFYRSVPFFDTNVTPSSLFIKGANVSITSSSGTETLVMDSTFDYFRCRWVPYYGGTTNIQRGETYDLDITHEGKHYFATTTVDQPKVEIDEVNYLAEFFDVYGGHDGVQVKLKDADGPGNFYRFQMNRMIDNSVAHAHILDEIVSDCTDEGELFEVVDLGRTIFSDENIDGSEMNLLVEVSFEYKKDDSAYVYIQSLDEKSAAFLQKIDNQLQAIFNPFVEPVLLDTYIEGDEALGFFGSAVRSDSVLFIYPTDAE